MGCGKIGTPPAYVDYISLLKKKLIQGGRPEVAPEECEIDQILEKINLEKVTFLKICMDGIDLTETDINKNLRYLADTYVEIKLSITNFFEVCHSECIKDFTLTDGMLIMLISIASSNKGISKFITSISPPYFIVPYNIKDKETKEIYEA